jgi:hypothetical protein
MKGWFEPSRRRSLPVLNFARSRANIAAETDAHFASGVLTDRQRGRADLMHAGASGQRLDCELQREINHESGVG